MLRQIPELPPVTSATESLNPQSMSSPILYAINGATRLDYNPHQLRQMLDVNNTLVTDGILGYRSQSLKSQFFVELWSLKNMRPQVNLVTASTNRLLFCSLHQCGTNTGASQVLVHPEVKNFTTAALGMAI